MREPSQLTSEFGWVKMSLIFVVFLIFIRNGHSTNSTVASENLDEKSCSAEEACVRLCCDISEDCFANDTKIQNVVPNFKTLAGRPNCSEMLFEEESEWSFLPVCFDASKKLKVNLSFLPEWTCFSGQNQLHTEWILSKI